MNEGLPNPTMISSKETSETNQEQLSTLSFIEGSSTLYVSLKANQHLKDFK